MNHFLMISKLEMKTVLGLFLLLIALACSPEKENSKGGQQSQNSQIPFPFKQKIVSKTPLKSKLDLLKEMDAFSDERFVISNKDSIRTYKYLTSVFEPSKIDSIEFCGRIHKHTLKKRNSPDVLLILYYNDSLKAKQTMNILEKEYRDRANFRAVEAVFKIGGMAFELNNQLCLISYHTCGGDGTFKSTRSLDSKISKRIFHDVLFDRLLSKCGMGPFKRIIE